MGKSNNSRRGTRNGGTYKERNAKKKASRSAKTALSGAAHVNPAGMDFLSGASKRDGGFRANF